MTKILGVHVGHDSGAALVVDGLVAADMAEERATRIKHYSGLPVRSVRFCLDQAGISIEDVDLVAVPSAVEVPALNHLFDLSGARAQRRSRLGRAEDLVRAKTRRGLRKPPRSFEPVPLPHSTEIVHVEHHLAHAASAYYTSGSDERQLIVTMDGTGDGVSVALWRGEAGSITPLAKHPTTASLGWFYSNVTEALGWQHGDGEGKTMGLAPYGDAGRARGVLDRFSPTFAGGDLVEPHDFGPLYTWNETGAEEWHLDEADQIADLVRRYGQEHVAAEAQRVLEEQASEVIFPWLDRERTRDLSCAGGVFLNVKLNQRIWDSGKVARHHVFPNPGDSGLAVGAALLVHHQINPGSPTLPLRHLYWGPEYSNEEIKSLLAARNLPIVFEDDIADLVARELHKGKIVGWFEGRMESGPRALGARSILMSPLRAENKDVINQRVKFREGFRPFCPSLLAEAGEDYLVNARAERFMITSFSVTPGKRDAIPAVVHVDDTVRPQTVERAVNEPYHEVIKRFGELSGESVVLNTSFNVKGEPIICHPREAIRAFFDTGLDRLVLGNYVLSKDGGW
jgi:carbamoyltransferase